MEESVNIRELSRTAARLNPHPDETPLSILRFPLWIKVGFGACMFIAIAVVLRRAISLLTSPTKGSPPQLVELDRWFATHAVLTWIHILCALAFVLVLPFVFRTRTQHSRALHGAFFLLGAITGLTAYAMSRYAVGGWTERFAVLFFDSLFLFSLAKAWRLARDRQNLLQQRIWMVRATAILLGIATTRPVMGIFFATARLSHLTPQQFFGIAFWIGFSINTLIIEFWLRGLVPLRIKA
jgi:hypothetical protein